MNRLHSHKWLLLVLLSLTALQVHASAPHDEPEVCEVCVLSTHDAIIPETSDSVSLHLFASDVISNISSLNTPSSNPNIEPIRGSPALS